MLTKQNFQQQHFMAELLGRRETGLPPAAAKTNELIAYIVHTRGFVLVYTCINVCYHLGQQKTQTLTTGFRPPLCSP